MTAQNQPATASTFENKFSKFCRYFFFLFVGWIIFGSLFRANGSSAPQTEPFDAGKMSRIPRVWPRPAWAASQKADVERGQFQRITENLQHGLDAVPQYEWRSYQPPEPVFTPYPWREYQPP